MSLGHFFNTFTLNVLTVPRKFFTGVDKIRRRFLWAREEELTKGKCKVSWQVVCTLIDNRGLNIPDPLVEKRLYVSHISVGSNG